ncbi:MAG: LD-carboxypeptidase [Eubacterium sp.]|nr:LD-carboxypeptidase [Eubacterium sp.]
MADLIKPQRLQYGDTIGIIAPSIALKPEYIQNSIQTLNTSGFRVQLSKHIFSDAHGFSGSIEERAEDFNFMISDDKVKMILFGGGEVCNEILPYIDYSNIRRHPKIICSYSDSTTILNAINYMSGLVTFYGASVRTFEHITDYNRQAFENRLMTTSDEYIKSAQWKTIYSGKCKGVLVGGYLVNYAALYGLKYYPEMPYDSCILFIEDHERFSSPAAVSKWFANLEHRDVFKNVTGLIFGHYSENDSPLIDNILYRIGEKYNIPVVRCEDYGHGSNNSILPIGISAKLDTDSNTFILLESGVV